MIITPHGLKPKPIYINRDYFSKKVVETVTDFKIKKEIHKSGLKRQMFLKITFTIDTELDKENVVKCDFTRFFEIEIHKDEVEHKEVYYAAFFTAINDTLSEIIKHVDSEIVPETIPTKYPLIDGIEKDIIIRLIYEELICP